MTSALSNHDFLFDRIPVIREDPRSATNGDLRRLTDLFPDMSLTAHFHGVLNKQAEEYSQALAIFQATFPSQDELIAGYLGLDRWETAGNKAEAITRIVNAYLNDLDILHLVDLGLTSLPENIYYLRSLEELEVSKNCLRELPDSIIGLVNLTRLDVSSNRIKELPENIGKLRQLNTLIASRNRLIELPKSVGNLTKLHTLEVGENFISKLPDCLVDLPNVTKIVVDCNCITDFPENITEAYPVFVNWGNPIKVEQQTEVLTPSSDLVSNFHVQTLKFFYTLARPFNFVHTETIDLRGSGLIELPVILFSLPLLKTILSDSSMKKAEMEELILAGRQLEKFPQWIDLLDKSKVKRVDLRGNNFSSVELEKLLDFPNLKELAL